MKFNPKVTPKRVMAAAKKSMNGTSYPGFCVSCGAGAMGVEPDACKYECAKCGAAAVYGAEELVLMIA